MKTKDVPSLILAVLVCEIAGLVGSFFTAPEISGWYAGLEKAELNPPSWVFGPVWTTLFALMGIALWLVITKRPFIRRELTLAVGIFTFQLVLNVLWSYAFFGLHDPRLAFFDLILLWLAIIATIAVFWKIRKAAAWFLVPYLLWVTFAGYLNYSVWRLNENPEKPPLAGISLPSGYSEMDYVVQKVTGEACKEFTDCETPYEYLLMSRCPFVSACIEGRCTVVCPQPKK